MGACLDYVAKGKITCTADFVIRFDGEPIGYVFNSPVE